MAQIFTWFPDASHQKSMDPRVRKARFGDGYTQRVKDGINTTPDIWELTFTGGVQEINAIDSFLIEHGGADYFIWTNPEGVQGHYICEKWRKQRERGVKVTLSCSFERVGDP